MIKLIVDTGTYVIEFIDCEMYEISRYLNSCKEELPGFSLENYSQEPVNSDKRESSDARKTVGGKDDLLKWMSESAGRHSKSWIVKHSPFPNAGPLLTQMERSGDVATALTPYVNGRGFTAYMQAYYIPGDEIPPPWPDDQANDRAVLLYWVKDNQGYVPKFVEGNCGIPRKEAARALTALILSKHLEIRKDPKDGKGRVHLSETSSNIGES